MSFTPASPPLFSWSTAARRFPNDTLSAAIWPIGAFHPSAHGWASVQLDGGIERVLEKVEGWFASRIASLSRAKRTPAGLEALSLGILTDRAVAATTAEALGGLAQMIVSSGGSVLLAATDTLLQAAPFLARTLGPAAPSPTLAYGQLLAKPGFHIVGTESDHWVENLTGLGGCGAQVMLGVVHGQSRQGHPFVPLAQVVETGSSGGIAADDIDGTLCGNAEQDMATLAELVLAIAGGSRTPAATAHGMVDFQYTRGLLGVST